MEKLNNNKKLVDLFFDKTVRIATGSETKTFPSGEYIATEDEYNKFDLKKYKKITLSFMYSMKINDINGDNQIFEKNEEYSMPKYKFDELEFSRAQWGELTLDCVLKNIVDLPFNAFNCLDNSALDCIAKEKYNDVYGKQYKDKKQTSIKVIMADSVEEAKKYEEETYTRIINQRPELVVFFSIRFLYEKLIIDKSPNVFKTHFKKYISDIKNLDSSNLFDHYFYKFFCNVRGFGDGNEIIKLNKEPNEILWDFIEFFFEDNFKNSNLALICVCIGEMDSDYLTSRFFSGKQNAIQEIYDALFEAGNSTKLAEQNFSDKVKYENTNMPLCSEFFAYLVSKLKYKAEYKDKFLELISFGGYKNYNGEYEIPNWTDQLELLEFVDPNFIRDNLDNNLVREYLETALDIRYQNKHKDYLKKIAEYSKDFHGNLKSEKDYLLKLIEIGCIEYVDTKFICDNIDDEIIQDVLSDIKSVDRQKDLFNYFHKLYNDENKPEEIKAIDERIDTLMKHCENMICNLDEGFIVNNLNKSYIRGNICRIKAGDKQQKICNNLYNQYQNIAVGQNEQRQTIIENVLFLIQSWNWKSCINYFDNDFIIELLLGKAADIVTNMFKYINKEKAQKLCSKLCEKYENSMDDEKTKCKNYIIKLIENVEQNGYSYDRVASYLSAKFVLDHLEDDIIKKRKFILIPETCQDLYSKYSKSQDEKKEYCKNAIIELLNNGLLDAQDLSIEFIVEYVFKDYWLKKINSKKKDSKKIGQLVEYLCNEYKSGEMDKSDCKKKIFKLIKLHKKAVNYSSVEFIAENFDTKIIQNNLALITITEKQKGLYNYFYGEYKTAKENQNNDLKDINKERIIKLIEKCEKFIVNANIDIEFIRENWNDISENMQGVVMRTIKTRLPSMYFLNQNNEPDFEKQEENKNEVLNWIKKLNDLINFVHPKFIAENLQNDQILDYIKDINVENLNLLYNYICDNYNSEEQKNKILVLIDKLMPNNFFISKRFLYDNFNEETVQKYISKHIKSEKDRCELWRNFYTCYLNDNNKTEGKQKLLTFIETCNKKIEYWDGYNEIDTPFICDCLGEKIIQEALLYRLISCIGRGNHDAQDKVTQIFKCLCEAQKEYKSKSTGKDRTTDILELIGKFSPNIEYVDIKFIYNNFNTREIKNALHHITKSQGKQLVNYIKENSTEDNIEQYFLTLINTSAIFEDYIDMKWIYEHLNDKAIQNRLFCINKKEHIQELYNCIVTSEKNSEQKTKDILMIIENIESVRCLCIVDAKFILDNLDNSKNGIIKKNVISNLSSCDDYYTNVCCGLGIIKKFVLRKLICAIELVQDKSEQDNLYLKLLSTLNYSTNVFRYTSVKFLEDRVDSENEDIKKYIAKNIAVETYQYEYGENAETIEKSGDIKRYDDKFVNYLFEDISKNNKDDNKFLEECLKYIKACEIHDLSSLAEFCEVMLTDPKIWDTFTKFIDECKTYDSSFFGKLLEKTDPDENLALKLIDSKYFLDENENDKQSCLNFFGRVLKSVDEYDGDYYKNFVCKLIDIDSKFVTEHINKKFLAGNCDRIELKKLINPKEENYALTEDDVKEMFKYLDPEKDRDKQIILEQINLNDVLCKYVSDKFLIENWDNENIKREITRRIKPVNTKGKNGLFDFLDVIEKRTDLGAENKKQASLKLLSFDKSGDKLIDDKRNLDFVIDNIECEEIQEQLKIYLQGKNGHTDYKKDILPKIQTKTEKDGWDEKRKEDAICILISCNYCAAVNFIDIKFLMNHDEGRAAIKDQVFNSEFYESENNIFNRVLKYLKRKTEKDGWSDQQKKDFISDLILNGGEKPHRSKSIAFNLKNPIVQDFMKEHIKPDDEIFKSLLDHLNHGYNSSKDRYVSYYNGTEKEYFENRILYLISLQPEFVIDYVHPGLLFNNREKDLVKSALESKKYSYTGKNYYDFVISLISRNPNLINNHFYVKFIFDEIDGLYCDYVKEYLSGCFGEDKDFGYSLFVALEDQLYSMWNDDFRRSKFLKLISLNPKLIIEWMISDKNKHCDKNVKFLLDGYTIEKPCIPDGIFMLCSENKNHNGLQKIFAELTNKILGWCNYKYKYLPTTGEMILCDQKNSVFLQKYLVYINQLNDIDKKEKILKFLKEQNIDLGIQTASVDKNNLREKDSKNDTDVKLINSDINKQNNNDMKGEIQKSIENTSSTKNINPEIDSNKNDVYTSETKLLSGVLNSNNNFVEQSTEHDKNIINLNENPIKPNLFKAKILHTPLVFAIGFIILSILFGVIGFVAKITLLYIINIVILFIGIVFLLTWSIKKCRKKNNDIRKINMMQDNDSKKNRAIENVKSGYLSNEYKINTNYPLQNFQSDVKQ